MSYFRKSFLLFVFMFGVFSAHYASAKDLCTSIQAHLTAVVEYCKGSGDRESYYPAGYSFGTAKGGSCVIGTTTRNMANICDVVNPTVTRQLNGYGVMLNLTNVTSVGTYCPDGANGSPCECKKGTNWQTKTQACVKSR